MYSTADYYNARVEEQKRRNAEIEASVKKFFPPEPTFWADYLAALEEDAKQAYTFTAKRKKKNRTPRQ